MQIRAHASSHVAELMRVERLAFAAKLRMARAVLGWSQTEFGFRVGLTQRAIHMLEQGETEPRRVTVRVIEEIWREEGIEFEEIEGGGFRVTVRAAVLGRPATRKARRERRAHVELGVTSVSRDAVGRA